MLALGPFPAISLLDACGRRDEAKRLLANGIDPSDQRKSDKAAAKAVAANTFGLIASEFIEWMKAYNAAESTITKTTWLLENLAKYLSKRPITEIIPASLIQRRSTVS